MERLRKVWKGRTMTFGVPLLLYLVGGSFGLREFAQIRYDVHKLHGKVDPALKEKFKQNSVTLESEYEYQVPILGRFAVEEQIWKTR
ncbi:cytochrome c oxidase assembly protein COX16 homolog, mitochondrial isoform 3-T4 [Phaethornis superciliosus]